MIPFWLKISKGEMHASFCPGGSISTVKAQITRMLSVLVWVSTEADSEIGCEGKQFIWKAQETLVGGGWGKIKGSEVIHEGVLYFKAAIIVCDWCLVLQRTSRI